MFELYNESFELLGYGSYTALKMFAVAENLHTYSIIAVGC